MSAYMDAITRRDGNGQVDETILGEFVEAWPNLCQAFSGAKGDDGKWIVGPATLMLFVECGQMKFCLSPKYTSKVCFGCVSDPSRALDGVEFALATGKCEWKARR